MSKDTLRQGLVIAALAATIGLNGLANALPLNGQTTGDVANAFPTFFTPASYVFSIWGVIYLGLIAYAGFQVLPAERNNPRLQAIGGWFLLSCVANCAWLVLWHYEYFALTMLAMLALLCSLIVIYVRLQVGRRDLPATERWLVHGPFAVYLGWITVATIANASVVLYNLGWNGFGITGPAWAAILLVVATAIGAAIVVGRADWGYGTVLVWAFIGIVIKYAATSIIAVTAGVTAAIIALLIVLALLRGPARGSRIAQPR